MTQGGVIVAIRVDAKGSAVNEIIGIITRVTEVMGIVTYVIDYIIELADVIIEYIIDGDTK